MAERKPVRPGTTEYLMRVQARVEEKLWARMEDARKNEELARKPDAKELREAHTPVMDETDPAAFLAGQQAFVARYGQEAWDTAEQRALARQRRDEGEAY